MNHQLLEGSTHYPNPANAHYPAPCLSGLLCLIHTVMSKVLTREGMSHHRCSVAAGIWGNNLDLYREKELAHLLK